MQTRHLSGPLLGCALLLGCGSQASPEYVGEPLLTLTGSVEIADERTDGPLHPALAFRTHTTYGDELHFLDVETEGEFPADFVLRVMTPPSQEVIEATRDLYERLHAPRPPFPVAYLTAVTADLPDVITAEPSLSGTHDCTSPAPCELELQWCLDSSFEGWDGDDCYSELRECPANALAYDDCTATSSEGNPDVRDYPWTRLAGLSENLRILYLPEALEADDPVAIEFDLPALEAGYHALEVTGPTEQEVEESAACWDARFEEALADYNAEHGTEYTYAELKQCNSELYWPRDCIDDGALAQVSQAVGTAVDTGTPELPCQADLERHRRVLSAEDLQHVSVRIAPDIKPSAAGRGTW